MGINNTPTFQMCEIRESVCLWLVTLCGPSDPAGHGELVPPGLLPLCGVFQGSGRSPLHCGPSEQHLLCDRLQQVSLNHPRLQPQTPPPPLAVLLLSSVRVTGMFEVVTLICLCLCAFDILYIDLEEGIGCVLLCSAEDIMC